MESIPTAVSAADKRPLSVELPKMKPIGIIAVGYPGEKPARLEHGKRKACSL